MTQFSGGGILIKKNAATFFLRQKNNYKYNQAPIRAHNPERLTSILRLIDITKKNYPR